MSPRNALCAGLLLMIPAASHAQSPASPPLVTSLRGRFQDPTTQAAVPGVQVKLTSMADTTDVHRVTAKDDGTFEVTGLGVHSYRLEASRLGYAPLETIIRVTRKDQDAGVLALTAESVPVSGITVTESPAPAVQKGDTTEFRAGAVKTHKDATAEDLVQKLPGVTVEGGQVKAQGENVQQVLVNGRPFFGSDPTAAMRNLPAEVVDRIQVYDRQSDFAEFSGFDDGQQQRTMNFILRDQRLKFGKVYAGGGDQDRYQAGGNATIVRGQTRLTALAMSNNINQRNFSPQDLFGALSGGGGGGGPRIMMFGG
ncbi:MAG: carboxypeptidase regulatory-like domain-containing protein, partial [Candidatus Eiseniibacteriota bacterium]